MSKQRDRWESLKQKHGGGVNKNANGNVGPMCSEMSDYGFECCQNLGYHIIEKEPNGKKNEDAVAWISPGHCGLTEIKVDFLAETTTNLFYETESEYGVPSHHIVENAPYFIFVFRKRGDENTIHGVALDNHLLIKNLDKFKNIFSWKAHVFGALLPYDNLSKYIIELKSKPL